MENTSDAEINGKAQEINDILKIGQIMEAEFIGGVQEIIHILQEIIDILKVRESMKILELPYRESLQRSTVVKEHRKNPRIRARVDTEFDVKVQKITRDIQLAREKLERSSFLEEFMRQMQSPEMVARIERVIGTDHSQLQLVLYGVGRLIPMHEIPNVENCQMQFAFAILLREKFVWVNNDIEVSDPILSPIERSAINKLNCISLRAKDNARRTVDRPTLFFMPRCPFPLYEDVLEANWTPDNLNKIIILGNRFRINNDIFGGIVKKINAVCDTDDVMYEIPLPETTITEASPAAPSNISAGTDAVSSRDVDPDRVFRKAFKELSWHFFTWDVSLCNTPITCWNF